MPWYFYLLLVIYFGVCIFLIFVILLQAGKGSGLSGLMGGGGGFGEQIGGSTSVEKTLNHWTTGCAICFAVISILLAVIGARHAGEQGVYGQAAKDLQAQQAQQQQQQQQLPTTSPTAQPAAEQQQQPAVAPAASPQAAEATPPAQIHAAASPAAILAPPTGAAPVKPASQPGN